MRSREDPTLWASERVRLTPSSLVHPADPKEVEEHNKEDSAWIIIDNGCAAFTHLMA